MAKPITRSRARIRPALPPSGNGHHADAPSRRGDLFERDEDGQLCYMTTKGEIVEILGVSAFLPQDVVRGMEADPEWGKRPEPPTYEVTTAAGDTETVVVSEFTVPRDRPEPTAPDLPEPPAAFESRAHEAEWQAWADASYADQLREYEEELAAWKQEQTERQPLIEYEKAVTRWDSEHFERNAKAMLFLGTRVENLPTEDSDWVRVRRYLQLYTPDPAADPLDFKFWYITRELLGNVSDDMVGLLDAITRATGIDPDAAKSGGADVPNRVAGEGRDPDASSEAAVP